MLFFNDPIPCDAPVLKAVQLALDMHAAFARLNEEWKKIGYQLGFGVGIASGYATMGIVGFEGRFDYTANGNAVNLAARLCDCAQDGEILISHRALVDVEGRLQAARVDDLSLKGIRAPVVAYRVLALVEAEQTA
jgi:class 3 adenylate cyclase